eukprot:CAMPEP_0198567916 /NCGR_PEP_ID=MMETSP1462-20131121/105560_1 /TAXON_ID=1333877 /ORGANISM="Brandtodinium nutriculum, Strain RCC3387" /LENGTH=44 /DNA_ID= /DNA_START= /DNA_END= /DNA_ORIENTATION=
MTTARAASVRCTASGPPLTPARSSISPPMRRSAHALKVTGQSFG